MMLRPARPRCVAAGDLHRSITCGPVRISEAVRGVSPDRLADPTPCLGAGRPGRPRLVSRPDGCARRPRPEPDRGL